MRPGVGQRRASLHQGPSGTEKGEHLQGQKEEPGWWEQCSKKTHISDVALQSPTAFHCIPLFHFSIWGLPHWSVSVEGALRPGFWEPFRAFTVDLLRFGQSKGEARDILTERQKQKQR